MSANGPTVPIGDVSFDGVFRRDSGLIAHFEFCTPELTTCRLGQARGCGSLIGRVARSGFFADCGRRHGCTGDVDRPGPARRWPLVERHRQRSRKTLLAGLIRQPSAGAASVRPRVTRACHSSSLGMYELHGSRLRLHRVGARRWRSVLSQQHACGRTSSLTTTQRRKGAGND
jgi:hypothetical protein